MENKNKYIHEGMDQIANDKSLARHNKIGARLKLHLIKAENLIKTNDKAKNDAFKMFSSRGFKGDINSFSTLIGLDRAYTANGGYIKDDYKVNEKGKRVYLNSGGSGEYNREEVGYDYGNRGL